MPSRAELGGACRRRRACSREASCCERFFERRQKHIDRRFGRERAHDADAEDLACEWAEAAGDLDAVPVEQLLAHFRVIDTGGHARRVEVWDAPACGHVHAYPELFETLDENAVHALVALEAVCQPF